MTGVLMTLTMACAMAQAPKLVRIGVPLEASGKFVACGAQGQRGVEMAVEAFGGTVAGHKMEILMRDIQSTNQGTVRR